MRKGQTGQQIAHNLDNTISASTVNRSFNHLVKTGHPAPQRSKAGRPQKLSPLAVEQFYTPATSKPRATALQLQSELFIDFDIELSTRTINRYRNRAGLSYKKLTTQARQADKWKELLFLPRQGTVKAHQLVCMDESFFNTCTSNSSFGWGDVGSRTWVDQNFGRGNGYSAMVILTSKGIEPAPVIQGGFNREEILRVLRVYVVSNSYPQFGVWCGVSSKLNEHFSPSVSHLQSVPWVEFNRLLGQSQYSQVQGSD